MFLLKTTVKFTESEPEKVIEQDIDKGVKATADDHYHVFFQFTAICTWLQRCANCAQMLFF